ncbi:MAG: hypothetical protein RL265_1401 [Bacteroidota bacterium]
MKKFLFLLIALLSTNSLFSQVGVVTVEKNSELVPVEQWYTIRDKEFDNHTFYYAETKKTKLFLSELLKEYDLDIDFPEKVDTDGDPYWVIENENGYITYLYLTITAEDSIITAVIE